MIEPGLKDVWIPAGLLLGFQVTLFSWRLEREVKVGDEDRPTWLAPADYVGIAGLLTFVVGVFLLPLIGAVTTAHAAAAVGLGALLFVGHFLGLCGHYELFHRRARQFEWFPAQERWVVGLIGVAASVYVLFIAMAGQR